jgi:Tfp pilus assembly protein PilO
MGTRRGDQIWLVGGLLTIIALVVASWFLVISPKFAQSDNVRDEVETAEIQLVRLNREVGELANQAKQKESYEAKLAASRIALPNGDRMPAFLREVQDSATAVGVGVSGYNMAALSKTGAVPGAYELPITLTATGSAAKLSKFFHRLQNVQSRAVLISSISLTPGASADEVSASINLKAFCLEPATVTKTDNCQTE